MRAGHPASHRLQPVDHGGDDISTHHSYCPAPDHGRTVAHIDDGNDTVTHSYGFCYEHRHLGGVLPPGWADRDAADDGLD